MTCLLLLTLLLAEPPAAPAGDAAAEVEASLPVLAADDADKIKDHEGEQVFVEGTVEYAGWSRSGKVMNIRFAGAGDKGFMAALFERDRETFDDAFDGDLAAALDGQEVRLKGEIQIYGGHIEHLKDRPEIILKRPSQITILKDEPATRPADEPADDPAADEPDDVEEVEEVEEEPAAELPAAGGLRLRDD